MNFTRQLLGLSLSLALVVASGCGVDWLAYERNPTATPRTPFKTPTAVPERVATVVPVSAVPPEVEQAAHEWPMANKNYSNTRATMDAAINAGNVAQLGMAWAFAIPGASKWGSAATNPLIANGVVYFQDLRSNIFALDFVDGRVIWQKLYDQKAFGPNGPAIGWGKLFAQNGINHQVALDLASGAEVWQAELGGPAGAYQPLVYGGYVYSGVGAGAYSENPDENMSLNLQGTSGHVYGIDQENGAILWSFQTMTDDYWGNPWVNSGAGVWFPPAIDTETGMTFWGTGNPAPMPGTVDYPNASSRPSPNLYSESMLAINGRTGELVWYNQVRPRDLFNYDFQNPPMLATAQNNGTERPLVIGTGKEGVVYAFDRASGELVWQTPVGLHENSHLTELPLGEVINVLPGFWGGIETPAAFADGIVYVVTANLPSPYTATAFDAKEGNEAVENIEGRTRYSDGTGEVVALDVNTGEILWSTFLPAIAFTAVTVVNDLIFTATYDGLIYALLSESGEIVWNYQAPGGIIAWPAVAHDTIVWPIGLGREPVLLALRLGAAGSLSVPAARPLFTPTPAAPTPAPVLPPPATPMATPTSG